MKSKGREAFTLIEIMVSVIMVSIISAAIYVTFAQGLRIWKDTNSKRPDIDIELLVVPVKNDFLFGLMINHFHFLFSLER